MPQATLHHESLHHVPEGGWTECAFSVLRAGKVAAAADYAIQRGSQVGQDLLFCIAGAGRVHSMGRSFEVEAGQFAWISNEAPHGHSANPRRPWTLLWLRLDGPNPQALRRKLLRDGNAPVGFKSPALLIAWFERLFSTMRQREPGLDIRLNQLVSELIGLVDAARAGPQSQRAPELLPAIAAMRAELGRLWTSDEISAMTGLSESQTRRVFQKHFGMSPRQWLLRERLIQAQSLMVASGAPLAEIAERCGFCDVYHFSREFKRSIGATPAAWRRGELSVTATTIWRELGLAGQSHR